MNKCKPFVGYHDPETCVYLNPIPGSRPVPTVEQLLEQWRQIEAQLAEAVRARETGETT